MMQQEQREHILAQEYEQLLQIEGFIRNYLRSPHSKKDLVHARALLHRIEGAILRLSKKQEAKRNHEH